jgi:hypothetical protein
MIITLDITRIVELLPYLLIGFGVGYLVTTGRSTSLDQKKHDLEVRKEWFRMLAEQKKAKEKYAIKRRITWQK